MRCAASTASGSGSICIELADGTRTIKQGTPVTFGLLAKLGRYEAARLTRA